MNRQDAPQPGGPPGLSDVAGSAELTLITELRPRIRSILYSADEPMTTTAVASAVHARGSRIPGHLIYRALVALERDAEARRAGRAGTAARAEALWELALTDNELNPEFERLAADPVEQGELRETGLEVTPLAGQR